MPGKQVNENMDTMKFKVPAQATRANSERTRVYNKSDLMSDIQRSRQTAENRRAAENIKRTTSDTIKVPAQRQSASTHKKRKTPVKTEAKPAAKKNSRPKTPVPPKKQSTHPAAEPQKQNTVTAKAQKKKQKSFFPAKIIRTVILIVIGVFLGYSAIALSFITKISPIENTGSYINDKSTMLYSSKVKNILVIGADSRDEVSRGLSDSIILLSINQKNHKLQITSFMRDMYTNIDGYGEDKLNAAYSYGGAELLKDTIEDNFKIRIDNCVTISFSAVVHAVDALGGIQITLSPEEAGAVNDILYSEVNEIMGDRRDADFLPGGGTYMLNGKQALSYSRIRYIGDADFERTQRQRTVITQMIGRMKKINIFTFNSNIKKAAPHIGSDMSVTDMYLLSLKLPFLLSSYTPEQMRIPAEGTWNYGETWDGQSIINVDFYANTEHLKYNIYVSEQNTAE